jgi:hypothetical protein
MDKLLLEEIEAADDMAELIDDMADLEKNDLDEAFVALTENILLYNLMREEGWYYG